MHGGGTLSPGRLCGRFQILDGRHEFGRRCNDGEIGAIDAAKLFGSGKTCAIFCDG